MKSKAGDPIAMFNQKMEEEIRKMRRPTILVAGYTGAGKTSLIQAICGKNVVPDNRIGEGLPKTDSFDFYESNVVRFFDSKGLEAGENEKRFIEEAKQFVRSLQDNSNVDNHIHLVWYTVQGPGARVTSCDLRLIKEIFPNVLVLITKNDITRKNQRDAMEKVLIDGGIPQGKILSCAENDIESLTKVVQLSYDILPEAYRDAFQDAQMIDFGSKHNKAHAIIHGASVAAAAAGAVPIPISDALIITPIQFGMIASLALIYNEPQEALKVAFGPAIAEVVGVLAATSLSKLIPGLGSAINATVAAALTEALGWIVQSLLKERSIARIKGTPVPELRIDLGELRKAYERIKK